MTVDARQRLGNVRDRRTNAVADTGIGMTPEQMGKARVHHAARRRGDVARGQQMQFRSTETAVLRLLGGAAASPLAARASNRRSRRLVIAFQGCFQVNDARGFTRVRLATPFLGLMQVE
jgi:hypothetical protein